MQEGKVVRDAGVLLQAQIKHIDGVSYCSSGATTGFYAVAISSLAGNTWDGSIVIVDGGASPLESSASVLAYVASPCGVADVCWVHRSGMLATADDSGNVQVHHVQHDDVPVSIKSVAVLSDHDDLASCVCASTDGATLASGSWDCTVKLWDLNAAVAAAAPDGPAGGSGGGGACITTLVGHTGRVSAVACHARTNALASASADGTLRLWDVRAAAMAAGAGDASTATARPRVAPLSVAWSPADDFALAAGCEDGALALYDTRKLGGAAAAGGSAAAALELYRTTTRAPIARVAFSPGGAELAAACDDGGVVVVAGLGGAAAAHSVGGAAAHGDYARALAWNPHRAGALVSGGWDGALRLLSVDAQQ